MSMHLSVQEYNKLFAGAKTGNAKIPIVAEKKTPKHHNVKVYVYADGMVSEHKDLPNHGKVVKKYDSKKEYARAGELALLQRAGKIANLQEQVPFLIADAFTDKGGKKHLAVVYRADFTYTENGKEIVEDVKGQEKKTGKHLTTETFRLKWKLLTAKYPDKVFRLY